MATTRDLLIHVTIEKAAKRRKCHHSRGKHHIPAGNHCLVIRNSSGLGSKNYCDHCAGAILSAARQRLDEIERIFREK